MLVMMHGCLALANMVELHPDPSVVLKCATLIRARSADLSDDDRRHYFGARLGALTRLKSALEQVGHPLIDPSEPEPEQGFEAAERPAEPEPAASGAIDTLDALAKASGADVPTLLALPAEELQELMKEQGVGVLARQKIATKVELAPPTLAADEVSLLAAARKDGKVLLAPSAEIHLTKMLFIKTKPNDKQKKNFHCAPPISAVIRGSGVVCGSGWVWDVRAQAWSAPC